MEDKIRLQKYLSESGVCSRRKAEEYILEGRVRINGRIVKELGTKVSKKDKVTFDNNIIEPVSEKKCIMLNKPSGYVTTTSDEKNRRCVMDLIHEKERYYPIGRLDNKTSGLLLLTNDGELANNIIHPSKKISKTYTAYLNKPIDDEDVLKLSNGVDIGDYITKPAKLKILDSEYMIVEIKISEGKNRQIRRMFEVCGYDVKKLHRTQIGNLRLKKELRRGKYTFLNEREIKSIFN